MKKENKERLQNWINKQTSESIVSYIVGFIAFILMLDGFFILPYEVTRYGLTNVGIETAFPMLLFAMILKLRHDQKALRK